jgi:hypothetical protein
LTFPGEGVSREFRFDATPGRSGLRVNAVTRRRSADDNAVGRRVECLEERDDRRDFRSIERVLKPRHARRASTDDLPHGIFGSVDLSPAQSRSVFGSNLATSSVRAAA